MKTKGKVLAGIIVLVLMITLAGCNRFNETRGRGDAPVGHRDDTPAEIINMPDEFGNVAVKCDGHGHRVYVVTHNKTDAPVTVIDDPSCPGGVSR
jgi:hypothetical protein